MTTHKWARDTETHQTASELNKSSTMNANNQMAS